MKTFRYLSACLLLLTGVLHVLPIIRTPSDPNSLPMMVFGIIYFTIGILLILKVKFDSLLGVVFPLIGLGVGLFVVGTKNWTSMLIFMFIIDAIVVISCSILLLNRNKG